MPIPKQPEPDQQNVFPLGKPIREAPKEYTPGDTKRRGGHVIEGGDGKMRTNVPPPPPAPPDPVDICCAAEPIPVGEATEIEEDDCYVQFFDRLLVIKRDPLFPVELWGGM